VTNIQGGGVQNIARLLILSMEISDACHSANGPEFKSPSQLLILVSHEIQGLAID
jgi:hypothetical protein